MQQSLVLQQNNRFIPETIDSININFKYFQISGAVIMKVEKHTRIYTDSLNTELHLVPSYTKMDFTISQNP